MGIRDAGVSTERRAAEDFDRRNVDWYVDQVVKVLVFACGFSAIIFVLGIFTFMGTWNDFLWPLIVTNKSSMMTLQIGLHSLQNAFFTDYALLMTGAAVSALPMIVVFLLFQPYFVRGVTFGALKG